ncbi:MAG TPA: hypothetical protein VMM93_04075 [Vicinamibacterales bacterium]|nr:hypothetical protein [Vicinamibacterales bacterium]
MTTRPGRSGIVAALLACLIAACVSRLPDQDRRIHDEVAIAKMSAADLWRDFDEDPAGARARYWGQAIEVSGTPTEVGGGAPGGFYLLFVETGAFGVRANLLDDDAATIVESAGDGTRLTLKCYCDGLDGHVVLRSCVTP